MTGASMDEELRNKMVTLELQGVSRRAIGRALGVSRNTVRKLLSLHEDSRGEPHTALPTPVRRSHAPTSADVYLEQIVGLLKKYPKITTQRIFEEVRLSGYQGSDTPIKVRVRKLRPKHLPTPSYVTMEAEPGQEAESDWSPYTVELTTGERITVQGFSYILRWSCRKYFAFMHRCDLHALMDGHVMAFNRFGGAALTCKYDSQKPVVLGWEGDQPIYNPRFVAFATHYEFTPQACRRNHPNDKPRVERSFWELERSFFNGRSFHSFDDLQNQLAWWLDNVCDTRVHNKTKRTANETFAIEKQHLRPLPQHPYDTARIVYRVVSIDGFVSYDGNRYAVPYEQVTDILPVRATQTELFVYAADLRQTARHELAPRGQGLDVGSAQYHGAYGSHRQAVDIEQLKKTFDAIGDDASRFFAGLGATHSRNVGHHARRILLLRERFNSVDLCAAMKHAHAYGAFDHHAVERIVGARAVPRKLAEYVDEEYARRTAEQLQDHDVPVRDLAEYDDLPTIGQTKETTPCRAENPTLQKPSFKE